MAPRSTETNEGFVSITMKSVPRTPIVACGVDSDNRSLLRYPMRPITERNTSFTSFAAIAPVETVAPWETTGLQK
jgi:hypothetical protein